MKNTRSLRAGNQRSKHAPCVPSRGTRSENLQWWWPAPHSKLKRSDLPTPQISTPKISTPKNL